ncbi:hypothetical protein FQR65_LT00110 [Abscondita terminalis]|nr:hypothetical protein FQR65_LT00110 [Abscondita terminalis]
MCITSIICISISITACQTKFDLTQCAPFMCFATSIAIIVITLIMILQSFLRLTGISIIIAGILGLLYCMYFMFDIQMIMGGRRIELSPEEYILAALTLYIDVIQILWAVIRILGTCK